MACEISPLWRIRLLPLAGGCYGLSDDTSPKRERVHFHSRNMHSLALRAIFLGRSVTSKLALKRFVSHNQAPGSDFGTDFPIEPDASACRLIWQVTFISKNNSGRVWLP